MDLVDIRAASSTTTNKRRFKKKGRVWRKRLHHRKRAVQPPTMQSEDGPKTIPEEWEPSSKKPLQEAQQRTHDINLLRFTCSQCKDNLDYVPKDLLRHFEENHRGSTPVFPCHMCTFKTHDFSYFQVHLLSHKDTFSSCSICNDNVKRTWAEFSAHLTTHHCQNGNYSCELCQKFSTADVQIFLEHMCVHHFALEGANEIDLVLHTKDNNLLGSVTTTQMLRCQHCGYEASQKWLLAKHINANHVSQNGNQKKKEVHSIAVKPNDPTPKMNPRLTRSAVREMCWLTQDCLSLPGREFLDKYCHLSDPQTTLEETQEFLMKSVAGETGDQKWTKALKTVLSNVPQDMNLHPKSDNGLMSNSADLTVLTVKNKITLPQNGATYAKRLKMMTEKDPLPPESAVGDAQCVVDQNGCQSDWIEHTQQTETKLNNEATMSAQNDPPECTQMQENRENQELKSVLDNEEHAEPQNAHPQEDGVCSELTVTNDSQEQMSPRITIPKNKRRKRRWKRKMGSKKLDRRSSALALKIVLKKNPVKGKQWVSQSSLSPPGGGPKGDHHSIINDTAQDFPLTEVHLKTRTKSFKTDSDDPSEAIISTVQSKPEELAPHCAAKTTGSKDTIETQLEGPASPSQEKRDDAGKSLQYLEKNKCRQAISPAAEKPSSDRVLDCLLPAADGGTPHSSYTKSSSLSHPASTPHGEISSGDASLTSEWNVEGIGVGELPADAHPDTSSTDLPAGKAIQPEPSLAFGCHRQLVPKCLERTLKLVAINPSQPIKRPLRDQPVVVLNHPDADIPEVARIMEVVNRYRGDVQKVILSRRTLNALSSETNDLEDTQTPSVQERFLLKLKLRRLSRKKYEVVGSISPSRDVEKKFSCWFCGRVFTCQETWMVHRQRHLMEWKRPNCENSLNVAHTG